MISAISVRQQTESFNLIRAGLVELATTEDDTLLIEVANEFIRADPEKRYLVELALESILQDKKIPKRRSDTMIKRGCTVNSSGTRENLEAEFQGVKEHKLRTPKSSKVSSTSKRRRSVKYEEKQRKKEWDYILSGTFSFPDEKEMLKQAKEIFCRVNEQLKRGEILVALTTLWIQSEVWKKERKQELDERCRKETDTYHFSYEDCDKKVNEVFRKVQSEQDEVSSKEIEIAASTVARLLHNRNMYLQNTSSSKSKSRTRYRSGDSVNIYMSEIGQVSRLSPEEEREICKEIASFTKLEEARERLRARLGRCPREHEWASETHLSVAELRGQLIRGRRCKNLMVASNLRLVISFAKRYRNRGVAFQDLIQEGTIGLIRGVEKYDADRGFRFSTYASWWIRQGIHRALLECSKAFRLPVHVNEMMKEIHRCSRALTETLGRAPTRSEIAMKIGISEQKVWLLLQRSQAALSLEMPLSHDTESHTLADVVRASSEGPEDHALGSLLRCDLEKALTSLSVREREVIRMRFGLDDGRTKSLGEVGSIFCVTRERVRQIETQALKKLRNPSCNLVLREYLDLITDDIPGMRKPMAVVDY
eukprot:jgi/Galph1/5290/GphlegSOOS_G3899.1